MIVIYSGGVGIKRPFLEIRNSILLSLASGQKTINYISIETQINWKTVERHLVYLVGRGWAREAFSSAYVRIFELTEFGKDYLRKTNSRNIQITDKKIYGIEHRGGL